MIFAHRPASRAAKVVKQDNNQFVVTNTKWIKSSRRCRCYFRVLLLIFVCFLLYCVHGAVLWQKHSLPKIQVTLEQTLVPRVSALCTWTDRSWERIKSWLLSEEVFNGNMLNDWKVLMVIEVARWGCRKDSSDHSVKKNSNKLVFIVLCLNPQRNFTIKSSSNTQNQKGPWKPLYRLLINCKTSSQRLAVTLCICPKLSSLALRFVIVFWGLLLLYASFHELLFGTVNLNKDHYCVRVFS